MENKDAPVTSYVVNRAKEPTTWAGVVQALAGAYIAFTAGDLNGAAVGIGVALTSLVSIFSKQRK